MVTSGALPIHTEASVTKVVRFTSLVPFLIENYTKIVLDYGHFRENLDPRYIHALPPLDSLFTMFEDWYSQDISHYTPISVEEEALLIINGLRSHDSVCYCAADTADGCNDDTFYFSDSDDDTFLGSKYMECPAQYIFDSKELLDILKKVLEHLRAWLFMLSGLCVRTLFSTAGRTTQITSMAGVTEVGSNNSKFGYAACSSTPELSVLNNFKKHIYRLCDLSRGKLMSRLVLLSEGNSRVSAKSHPYCNTIANLSFKFTGFND